MAGDQPSHPSSKLGLIVYVVTFAGLGLVLGQSTSPHLITIYYIDTDEIPGFFLSLKNHIFSARSEDTIFIFHV